MDHNIQVPEQAVRYLKEKVKDYEYCYIIINKLIAKKGEEIHICDEALNIKHVIPSNKCIEEFIDLLVG